MTTDRTGPQQLRDFCADYSVPKVYLRPYEEFLSAKTEPGRAIILTREYTVVELSASIRITHSRLHVRVYRWVGNQHFLSQSECMKVEDTEFEPIIIGKYSARPVSEYVAKRDWARMCNKPGTDKRPQYSYRRLLDEPELCTNMSPKYYG